MTLPWLSVVTVVKDDASGFSATAHSLAAQNIAGLEYLVIDGSIDGESIPERMNSASLEHLAQITVYQWIAPTGIYQAMNTGLSLARGTFVYFLNAGDVFVATSVLKMVRDELETSNAAWSYAPVEIEDDHGSIVTTPPWDFKEEAQFGFARGHFPCHQGTFVRTDVLRSIGGFDTSFMVAADYAVFLRLAQVSPPLEIDGVVARFVEGGTSTRNWRQSILEFHRARRSILDFRGMDSLREYVNTALQFVKVGLYRGIVKKWRTP